MRITDGRGADLILDGVGQTTFKVTSTPHRARARRGLRRIRRPRRANSSAPSHGAFAIAVGAAADGRAQLQGASAVIAGAREGVG